MKKEVEERDTELENIVGNLLIAEYQVERLRAKVIEKIESKYGYEVDKETSTHIFKSNGRWVKISLKVEKMRIDTADKKGQGI